jgi:hypothetical protein
MSQRPSRHQRRASQGVFVLPENFSVTEHVALVEAAEQKPAFNHSTKPMPGVEISNEEKPELMKDAFVKNITGFTA